MKTLSSVFALFFASTIAISNVRTEPCETLHGNNKYTGACANVNQCTGAALKGNCTGVGITCCIKDTESSFMPTNPILNLDLFLKSVGNTTRNTAIYNHFSEVLDNAEINSVHRVTAFLATIISESNYFRDLESPLQDADNVFGNSALGDGSLFRGRGGILIRGKDNYILANQAGLNLGTYFIKQY